MSKLERVIFRAARTAEPTFVVYLKATGGKLYESRRKGM
jgi:hypothetical protein